MSVSDCAAMPDARHHDNKRHMCLGSWVKVREREDREAKEGDRDRESEERGIRRA